MSNTKQRRVERVQQLLETSDAQRLFARGQRYDLLMNVVEGERWPLALGYESLEFVRTDDPPVREAVLLTIALERVLRLAKYMERTGKGFCGSYVEVNFPPAETERMFADDPEPYWFLDLYTSFEPPQMQRYCLAPSATNEFAEYTRREVVPLIDLGIRRAFEMTAWTGSNAVLATFALRPGRWQRLLAGSERHPALAWRPLIDSDRTE